MTRTPSIGWQSWSPPFPKWHGFPRWDYSPFKKRPLIHQPDNSTTSLANIRYWCSWYAYGWNITAQKISETLSIIKKHNLPFTHILIDDGWTTWGDWHTPDLSRFSDLSTSIALIKSHNLRAGLWFAPFLASSKSKLFKNHPNWFLTHKNRPIQGLKTMPIWESLLPKQYLLNLELPAVKKYLTDFIDLAVSKWGVDLLKLDFLYAPYFNPHLKSDDLPHEQVTWILSYIKLKYPKVMIIACGSPFVPTIGLANIVRISKDTALPPVVPELINRLVYHSRTNMLSQKLQSGDLPPNIGLDPDVRMFCLDSHATSTIWDTIHTNILGVGDKLSTLSPRKIEDMKLWLTNHNFQ